MSSYQNPFDINNFVVVPEVAASPAAAANYIGAVPVNARSTLALLSFLLVTDANVADRLCEIQLHRGADVYIIGHAFESHGASLTRKYLSFPGAGAPFTTVDDCYVFSLPDLPLFLEGDTVRIVVNAIQAADQLSAIRLTWKVWPYEQLVALPTLDDIPIHLRSLDQKDAFLSWVHSLPVENWVRRGLTNIWQKLNDYRFSANEYRKAGLLMPRKYAHLLPLTVEVWERFLALHESDYSLLEYDVRVGLGRDPGDGFEGNIRQMALDLSFRRIDCVAHTPTDITVIEITHSAGFTALGQIAGYAVLYSLTYSPLLPIKSLLVCGEIQSDIKPILDSLDVKYIVV